MEGQDNMDEYSRILIEDYCRNNDTAKSKRLYRLVRKSYDLSSSYTDGDGAFIDKLIAEEDDKSLKEALEDLMKFMFGW